MPEVSRRARAAARAVGLIFILGIIGNAAQAYPTSWEFKGTVTVAEDDWAGQFPVGTPMRVVVSFDTSETISSISSFADPATGVTGKRYRYFGPQSLKFSVFIGSECNPCVPSNDAGFDPSNNFMIVRDNFPGDTGNGTPIIVTDGISMSTLTTDSLSVGVILRDAYDRFAPPIVSVTGTPPQPLPVVPDPRLTNMAVSVFQACRSNGAGACLLAKLDSVAIPSYGSYYFLSGRHCQYPDLFSGSRFYGDDCIVGGGPQALVQDVGGSAGQAEFSSTVTHKIATPDPTDAPDAVDVVGTVFGTAAFGGPGGLPILRGSSFPTAVGRTNANLLAYQEYTFNGSSATPLQLIVDLGYQIFSNGTVRQRPNGTDIEEGLRPGGATIGTTLSVVDASKVPAASMAALRSFNSLVCGNEAAQDPTSGQYLHTLPDGVTPWPAGSILAMATYLSPESEQGVKSVQLKVLACNGTTVSTEPMTVQPGQSFYLTSSLQSPARGLWAQSSSNTAAANGLVDAANTVRVIPDPKAPPAVLQQLAQGLAPACDDCSFAPELLIDVKPGSADNPINVGSTGTIPVALFGSDRFNVREVATGTLRLGALLPRVGKNGQSQCAISDLNLDGLEDLVCHFQNQPGNWVAGQTIVTLTGALVNGESIFASDAVRLVP